MYLAAAAEPSITEWVAPIISGSGAALVAIIVGAFALWNRKRGAIETRAPDVNEIWQQQARQSLDLDRETRLRRKLENLVGDIWLAFTGYVRRVQAGGSMELTTYEQRVLDNGQEVDATAPERD